MANTLTVTKDSEFFISIAKSGVHSFLMLGVFIDRQPVNLVSLGKQNLIDPGFGLSCASQGNMICKSLFANTQATLANEYNGGDKDISYQAYSISYQHYLEFLKITQLIHNDQLRHYQNSVLSQEKAYDDMTYPEKGLFNLRKGIFCYLPIAEVDGKIQLANQHINSFKPVGLAQPLPEVQDIVGDAKVLSMFNTCRTTARSLINYVLGFIPNIPKWFAFELSYRTTLKNNASNLGAFYVLPPPPNCFNLEAPKMEVLHELYQRIENVPQTNPQSQVTKQKFEQLKKLYNDLTASPHLSLDGLLVKITEHRVTNDHLFNQHRGEGAISLLAQKLGLKTETQASYERMVRTVMQELSKSKNSIAL